MTTVLLVDSDPARAEHTEETLRRAGHVVWSCASPGQALQLLDRGRFEVALAAADLGTMPGIRMLEITAQLSPETVRVLRADTRHLGAAVDAVERGVIARFLPDPCDDQLLREVVAWADRGEADDGPPSLQLRLSA